MVEQKRDSHTLFVDYLPMAMSNLWLRQLFNNYGKVVDGLCREKYGQDTRVDSGL